MFDQTMLKSFGFEEMMSAQEKTAKAIKEATTTLADCMSKMQSTQMQQNKDWMQQSMSAAQEMATAKTMDEFFSKQAQCMQQMAQAQMSATQELANTWGSATNQATDIISKQMMNNVSSYMNQAQKVANSMSTQASKAASSSSK
jgi:hypothetical protein